MRNLLTLTLISLTLTSSAHAGKMELVEKAYVKSFGKRLMKNSNIEKTQTEMNVAMSKASWEATSHSPARIPFFEKDGLKILSVVNGKRSRFSVHFELQNLSIEKKERIQALIDANKKWIDQGQSLTNGGRTLDAISKYYERSKHVPRLIEIEVIPTDYAYMRAFARMIEEVKLIASSNAVLTRKVITDIHFGKSSR